jgi:hypothetical protein
MNNSVKTRPKRRLIKAEIGSAPTFPDREHERHLFRNEGVNETTFRIQDEK